MFPSSSNFPEAFLPSAFLVEGKNVYSDVLTYQIETKEKHTSLLNSKVCMRIHTYTHTERYISTYP
jgi:hypothetical protein